MAQIEIPKEQLAAFCRQRHIRRLAIFGSVLRPDFGPHSDIDVLVEFEGRATFDGYVGLKDYLEDIFGAKVDLATEAMIKPRLRRHIEKDLLRVA